MRYYIKKAIKYLLILFILGYGYSCFSYNNRNHDLLYVSTYTNLTNAYRASTKFSGIGTGRSGNSCPVFSFNNAAIENAQVDGIYFIDYYSTTQYTGIEFLQNGGIDTTCNSSQYTIPYKILP